jgi:hypothetical protein
MKSCTPMLPGHASCLASRVIPFPIAENGMNLKKRARACKMDAVEHFVGPWLALVSRTV